MLHMQGNLCVFDNAAFFVFLILGKSHKETKKTQKKKTTIIDLCHLCFFILTFFFFIRKSFQLFILLEKNTTTTKPPSYTLRSFHIFGFTFSGPKEVCWFWPSETRSSRTPLCITTHSFKKKGPACLGEQTGVYGAFMLPSCVVWPTQRPWVKASCKIYVHAAVSVGGKINIAGLMHGDDWVLSDWQ